MPSRARIIERRRPHVNAGGRRRGAALARSVAVLAIAAALVGIGCGKETRARRLYEQATDRVEEGDLAGAVQRLDRILAECPDSSVAGKAREEAVLYRGLLDAAREYPIRRIGDLVLRAARAIERFHDARGSWPESLDALVPDFLPSMPEDPSGRALDYARRGAGGYVLAYRGADGLPGGEGESADIVVENGVVVSGKERIVP